MTAFVPSISKSVVASSCLSSGIICPCQHRMPLYPFLSVRKRPRSRASWVASSSQKQSSPVSIQESFVRDDKLSSKPVVPETDIQQRQELDCERKQAKVQLTHLHQDDREVQQCEKAPRQGIVPAIATLQNNPLVQKELSDFPALQPPGHNFEPFNLIQYAWPRALLMVVAMLWGTSMACVKLVGTAMNPSDGAMARFALAALALAPSLVKGPRLSDRINREEAVPDGLGRYGIICGIWIFMGYMTQSVALQTTDAGKSAFICSLAVVFVPFITSIFPSLTSQHKKSRPSWLAAILAVAGVGYMELGGHSHGVHVGDIWALGQTIGFGMGFIENERALEEFPRHALQLSAIQLAVVAVLSSCWSILSTSLHAGMFALPDFHVILGHHLSAGVFASLLYTGLITTAMTIFLENVALIHVSAGEMAVILSTEPLFASAWAAFLLHETMGSEALVGGVLIIAACLVNQVGNSKLKETLLPALASILFFCGDKTKDVI